MPRPPKDLWNDLLAEAGEDEIDAAASVSVEQAERELAAAGFDVKAERAKAQAFLDELSGAPAALGAPAPAKPAEPARRRRPSPAVLWLAAAATVTVTGGVLYATLHNPGPAPTPSPSSPAPTPTRSPPPSTPPLVAASDLRLQAKAALDAGRPLECLSLLDQARAQDPAGDAAPDVTKLRAQAQRALKP